MGCGTNDKTLDFMIRKDELFTLRDHKRYAYGSGAFLWGYFLLITHSRAYPIPDSKTVRINETLS